MYYFFNQIQGFKIIFSELDIIEKNGVEWGNVLLTILQLNVVLKPKDNYF